MKPVIMKLEFPFCFKPCEYCYRNIIAGWDSRRMDDYTRALIAELLADARDFDDCEIVAIRYGGGIASLAGSHIAEVQQAIARVYHLSDDIEITMRSSVSNFSGATMPYFRRAGIGRFDLEMMSLFQPSFNRINHQDAFKDFPIVCDNFLRSYANRTLGLTLLYGYTGQTTLDVRRSLLAAASTHVAHIELQEAAGGYRADEATVEEHYAQVNEILPEKGFIEYVPKHFARPGDEDRFLTLYGQGVDVLSFGLGAITRTEGALSTNTSDLDVYLAHSDDYTQITVDVKPL